MIPYMGAVNIDNLTWGGECHLRNMRSVVTCPFSLHGSCKIEPLQSTTVQLCERDDCLVYT